MEFCIKWRYLILIDVVGILDLYFFFASKFSAVSFKEPVAMGHVL